MTYMPEEQVGGRSLVDSGSVVICGMMPEKIALEFAEFVDEGIAWESFATPGDLRRGVAKSAPAVFYCTKLPDRSLDFQVRFGDLVLTRMGSGMAKLYARLCKTAVQRREKSL